MTEFKVPQKQTHTQNNCCIIYSKIILKNVFVLLYFQCLEVENESQPMCTSFRHWQVSGRGLNLPTGSWNEVPVKIIRQSFHPLTKAAIGNQRWNKKPGDPQDMYYGWRLDGWEHITRNDRDTGIESQYRIPAPVDPVNWRPLSAEEKDLFAKRLEKGAKVSLFVLTFTEINSKVRLHKYLSRIVVVSGQWDTIHKLKVTLATLGPIVCSLNLNGQTQPGTVVELVKVLWVFFWSSLSLWPFIINTNKWQWCASQVCSNSTVI